MTLTTLAPIARSSRAAPGKPTICQVVHCLSVGGAELLAAGMARSLQDHYRFVFACLDEEGPVAQSLMAEGFPVHVLNRRPGIDFACSRRLARVLRRERVDLVHAHQYTPWFQTALARTFRGHPPILFTEHGRHHPDTRRLSHVVCNRLLTRPGDRIVGVGEAVRTALIDNEGFAKSRVGVVYNGVDLEPFTETGDAHRRAVREELGLEGATIILQVARLNHLKDHATAFRTIERVVQQVPGAVLLLAGDGEEAAALRSQVRERRLEHCVRFLGTRRDVPRLLAAADIFLLTSISEGIPLTIIEAMAAQVPVVSTNVGGIHEMLDERTGRLAPAGDDEKLASHLIELAQDASLRRQLGLQGRERAWNRFSQQRMNESYCNLYDEMLRKGSRVAP